MADASTQDSPRPTPAANGAPARKPGGPSIAARLSRGQRLVLVLLALFGSGVAVMTGQHLRRAEEQALRAEIDRVAEVRMRLLRSSTLRSLEVLRSMVAFLEANPGASRAAFRRFVDNPMHRLSELQAFEWIPRVPRAERAAYEAAAQAEGFDNFHFTELDAQGQLRTAGPRDAYFPVYYVEPPQTNLPALGLDVASHAGRRAALHTALQTGQPAATAPIRLAQETQPSGLGLLVFAPVFAEANGSAPRALHGFALSVLRFPDFVATAFAALEQEGFSVKLVDREQPSQVLFESPGGLAAAAALLSTTETLALAGRTWSVTFAPTVSFIRGQQTREPEAYAATILALTLLVSAYVYRGMRHTHEVEHEVTERTAALTHEVAMRKETEEALRITEARYRNMFEHAVMGIFQTSADGTYLDVNPALVALYGYESRSAFMTHVRDIGCQIYVDPERRKRFMEIMDRQGSVTDFVSEARRKDGARIWIAETAVSVRDDGGKLLYYEGSVQDITERVQAEETRRRSYEWLEARVAERTAELADANARLTDEVTIRKAAQEEAALARQAQTQFLASISHEIRTPLNAIIGYSQILQRYDENDALQREALQTIVQSGQHLATLVDEVMDLSKIESGHVQPLLGDFDLGALISSVSFMLRPRCERRGLRLVVEGLGTAPCWVRGDEGKLRQVLINLLGNAEKFTDRGEVRLRVVPEDAGQFRFEVIDTGPGIDPEKQEQVFAEFYQTESSRTGDGVGLGLAISRRLVELMGGELKLRSTKDRGSNFFFTLTFAEPLSVVPSQANSALPRIRLSRETPCRALVVDDMQVNRDILSWMLSAVGCTVHSVDCGEAALSFIREHEVDVVFLDILMPGMDGIETAQAMRALDGAAPLKLVAYSASALQSQRELYLSVGFDAFLAKPFRMERVNDCLSALLPVRFVADERNLACGADSQSAEAIQVPQELRMRIREAAASYQVTLLRGALTELEQRGAQEQQLAERLRAHTSRYEMSAVLSALDALEGQPEHAA